MTTTHAKLAASESTFQEIERKLKDAGYHHCFLDDETILMNGLAIIPNKEDKTTFGCGYEDRENEFAMWYGPSPNLIEMINRRPDEPNRNPVIIKFFEGTSRVIYRWYEECWHEVDNDLDSSCGFGVES